MKGFICIISSVNVNPLKCTLFTRYEDVVMCCVANLLPAPIQKLLMKEFIIDLRKVRGSRQRSRILLAFMLRCSRKFCENFLCHHRRIRLVLQEVLR